MKKLGIIAVAICFAISGFAQVGEWPIESFRLQGTSIIEDDFDNAIDPIDIGRVEGSRLYTNLSNLLNYDEQILANVSLHQHLLGYSGSLLPMVPALKTAILIESKREEDANFVSIVKPPMSGWGFVSGDYTEWDNKDYEYWFQSKKNEQTRSDRVFLLNNLYELETMKLGARISYLSGEKTRTTHYFYPERPSFEEYYKEHTDAVGKTTDTTAEKGNYFTERSYSDWDLLFSGAMPMAGLELRGNLNFAIHSENTKPDDHYSWYSDDSPHTDKVVDIADITRTVTGKEKRSDMGIGLSGRARRYIEGGYFEAGAGLGMTFGDIDDSIRNSVGRRFENRPPGGWKEVEEYEEYSYLISSGDYSDLGFRVSGKGILPFGEELLLGIGVKFEYWNYKEEVEKAPVEYYKYEVDNGDTIAGNEDSLHTRRTTSEEEVKTRITTTSWNLPVGFEYKFGKKKDFRLRLGATAIFVGKTQKVTETKTKPEETVVHAEYKGDRRDFGTTYTESAYYGTKVEETPTYKQSTEYTYGLGWYPTENLQIDLLGFLEPTGDIWSPRFYRNLRLSVTFKF